MQTVPAPPARHRMLALWGDQAGRRTRCGTPAGMCPLRGPATAVLWTVRADPTDRAACPQRTARHLRRLLPDALGDVCSLRSAPAVLVRRRPRAGLRQLRDTRHRALRTLRNRPCTGRALARGAGLRCLLHRRTGPSGNMRRLRPAAPISDSAGARGHPLRGLHRQRHLALVGRARVRRLRPRGQALRARPVRPLRPARSDRSPTRWRPRPDPAMSGASPIYEAIIATDNPRSALNWLRNGSGLPARAGGTCQPRWVSLLIG
jgi:hypothetical protein